MDSDIYVFCTEELTKLKIQNYYKQFVTLSNMPLNFKNIKCNTDATISSYIFFNANTTKGSNTSIYTCHWSTGFLLGFVLFFNVLFFLSITTLWVF